MLLEEILLTILVLAIAAIFIVIVYYCEDEEVKYTHWTSKDISNVKIAERGDTKMNKEQALAKIKELESYIKCLDKETAKIGQIWLVDGHKNLVTKVSTDLVFDIVYTLEICEFDGVDGVLKSNYFPVTYFLNEGTLLGYHPSIMAALVKLDLELS